MYRKEPLISVLKVFSQNACKGCVCKIPHNAKHVAGTEKLLCYRCCYPVDDVDDIHDKRYLHLAAEGTEGQETMTFKPAL